MSMLSSLVRRVARAGSKALGGAVERASGGFIPARVLTIPRDSSQQSPPAASTAGNTPVQMSPDAAAALADPISANWSTFVMIALLGIIFGLFVAKWTRK